MNTLLHVHMGSMLRISSKGQITLPKKVRDAIKTDRVDCEVEDGKIILSPLKSYMEFLKELDDIADDFDKNGGVSLEEVKKRYGI